MKKIAALALSALMGLSVLTGCGGSAEGSAGGSDEIVVVSREDGSGTRSAFVELMGIEQKDANGNKVDKTTLDADITDSTSVMLTTVAGNKNAIGYVSLGSYNDTVKALNIDGVEATAENVKSGAYAVSRPFNIATCGEVDAATERFIEFILSAEGQAIIEEAGYISAAEGQPYTGAATVGKVVVAGSSSVSPVMEKLAEAYEKVNPNAEIEIQTSDSTNGMNSTKDGICQIGMASRELKESELEAGLSATVIAVDGIAVIVNHDNPVDGLTSEQVRDIYTGVITAWNEAK